MAKCKLCDAPYQVEYDQGKWWLICEKCRVDELAKWVKGIKVVKCEYKPEWCPDHDHPETFGSRFFFKPFALGFDMPCRSESEKDYHYLHRFEQPNKREGKM